VKNIELYAKKCGYLHLVDKSQWNALHYSAHYAKLEANKKLIEYGLNFQAINNDGKTPLQIAMEQNEIKKFLLELDRK